MTVKDRLLQFLKINGLSQGTFEESVGVSNGFVNNMGDAIRPNSVRKIAKAYPDLNTAWLLTGEGNMLRSETSKASNHTPENKNEADDYRDKYIKLLEKRENDVSLNTIKIGVESNQALLESLFRHLVGDPEKDKSLIEKLQKILQAGKKIQ